jgi:hypothetical protein
MIPSYIKHDSISTPPQWTDGSDQVIEKGTHVRIKLKGIRNEVGEMFAIATINEDFLGYEVTVVLVSDLFTKQVDPFLKNKRNECFSTGEISLIPYLETLALRDSWINSQKTEEPKQPIDARHSSAKGINWQSMIHTLLVK